MEDYPRNLAEFEARFSTEAACREYLLRLRWPDGFRCPRCGGRKDWPVRGFLRRDGRDYLPRHTHAARLRCVGRESDALIEDAIEPSSVVHTDGWTGYDPLERKGYRHYVTFLKGQKESASELLPRVHLVASLLKRWLLGTHQGAVSREHLDYYLDEFTFRFNRRNSRSRGKLFLRLAEQAVAVGPAPYKSMVKCFESAQGTHHNI